MLSIQGLPMQAYWRVRKGFPQKMQAQIKTERRVEVKQKKGWKKNCGKENGTLKDTRSLQLNFKQIELQKVCLPLEEISILF